VVSKQDAYDTSSMTSHYHLLISASVWFQYNVTLWC